MTQESVSSGTEVSEVEVAAPVEEVKAQPEIPQKIRVKIDGTEDEVDLETLKRDYQKFKSADRKFEEAAALRKEFGPIAEKIKAGDFGSLAKTIGEDKAREWAEKYLLDWLQYQEMPEAEKKAMKLEQELQAEREARKAEHEERNKEAYEIATKEAYQEIDQEISEALKAMGKTPTPRMIARIAETMLASLVDETKPRMAGKQAAEHTLSEFTKDFQEYLGGLPPEELRKMLPKKTLDAFRKAEVDEVLSQSPQRNRPKLADDDTPAPKKTKNMTTDDWFKQMERRLG